MKKILVALALASLATGASAAVSGSKHDLRLAPYSGTFPSACMYCHTPHHAQSSIAPIWARSDPSAIVVTNIFGGALSTVSDRTVRTCLTCHATAAGVTGIGGVTANMLDPVTASPVLGTDLSTQHPVGSAAIFTGVASDGFVAAPTFTNLTAFGAGDAMDCATCHDVHAGDFQAGSKLLRAYSGTDFCGTCHNK